ncbi:glycosyltransferase family 2 protein [Lapillicoccus jejuensis]|uniref:GT2 family glycosyltransferase n=1 Tax=Lapillicoccus jejuensis TaxID=402171 RepID=A0A542E1G3_9MICO|nr:glycosyltransferase family 2 protein [Lapillicoccus jejuensis]TQJ09172.1 GT2 family glycosyltransferase [Lapillicoccus jejuensis]
MTPTGPPVVGVVVVTYQSEAVVAACLAALGEAARTTRLDPVVVVDNASTDATTKVAVDARPGVVVLPAGGNLGYAAAINLACAQAVPEDVDAVLVLNPDAVLAPGSVDAMVGALHDGAGLAVPVITAPGGAVSPSLRRWPGPATAWSEALLGGGCAGRMGWGETVCDPAVYERAHDIDWATGAVVLVGADARRVLGPWDESFFLYSEETELMLRARRAGIAVRFVPDARCAHEGGASGTSPQLWGLLLRNKVLLYGRDHGRLATACFRAGLLVGQGLRAIAGSRRSAAAVRALCGGPVPQGDSRPAAAER